MNQQPLTDIVGLLALAAALMFSPSVAAVVGPYLVIVIASAIGASFAVARREKATRLGAVFFFTRVVGLACLLTVGTAAAVAAYKPEWSPRLLIAPIALMIGFIGDSWPALLRKVMDVIFKGVDLIRGKS